MEQPLLDPHLKLALEFASDLAKQLITLSTGIVAVTITFTKDILKRVSRGQVWILAVAWGVYLLSVVLGILSLMALTGTLEPLDGPPLNRIASSARMFAGLQIVTFLLATSLVIWYGILGLRSVNQE